MNSMRLRSVGAVVAGVAAALVLAGCTAGGAAEGPAPSAVDTAAGASHAPVTVTLWSPWTGNEYKKFKEVFKGFHEQYPWITVDDKGGIPNDKLIAGINSGKPPDVSISFGVDDIGKFCQSGAWQDLNPYIKGENGLDLPKTFPASALTYTSFNGTQCALPFLTDSYGMYMNDDQLSKAGITTPPKTLDELQADAKKLTTFDADGNITRAGFVPWFGYYCCSLSSVNVGNIFGAKWYNADGTSAFASDPAWAQAFEWQKKFVTDVYGNGDFKTGLVKLKKFAAGAADEWGCSQDFIKGRISMSFDGEWRNAMMKDCASAFSYSTAPWPVPADKPQLYGSGTAGGTTIGMPKGAAHPAEAWLLIRYLTSQTEPLVYMANLINNVPTTFDSLKSPDLQFPKQFQTFLDVYQNPLSGYRPSTTIGDADESAMGKLMEKWQDGSVTDINAGLTEAAKAVDLATQQVATP